MTDKRDPFFTIKEAGEILGSSLEGDPGFHLAAIYGIRIDSRLVSAGDLFVAVKGERYDGHDFIEETFSRGVEAAVVSKQESEKRNFKGERFIAVDDTVSALGELAAYHRGRMKTRIAAVTGSNGKTTVKNLIYEVLSKAGPSVKSSGNFNNLYGLPLSIFQLEKKHQFAVFELGMSGRGEISRLGEIARPDLAVITNVGPAHLEYFESIDDIAMAKLEIAERIKPGGALIVNGDDEILNKHLAGHAMRLIRFGLSSENDIFAANMKFDDVGLPRFEIDGVVFESSLPGVHNVYNILAAYAVCRKFGIGASDISSAIKGYRAEGMRSQIVTENGITMIIDCYNANPVSMRYALDTLAGTKCGGKRIAVLGDMLELGKDALRYHEETGRYAAKIGIDKVFGLGALSRAIVKSFGRKGRHLESKDELIEALTGFIGKNDVILFKASRGIALEDVIKKVREKI